MIPTDFGAQGGEWLREDGPESDIVMSSRIRLARNLEQYPFVTQATGAQRQEIEDLVKACLMKSVFAEDGLWIDLEEVDEVTRMFLVERHLISRELAVAEGPRGLAFRKSEVAAVMVNEEDHLRMQVIHSGLELDRTWEEMAALDDALEKRLDFAFSPQFGYLTACPTNVGTGMRASVMLHLPALVMTKEIEKVFQAVSKINLAVRGLYGEGTQASGDFYQISNQVTLGRSESAVIDNIRRVVPRIILYERNVREHLMNENRVALEDKVFRAFGVLRHARSITSEETTNLLSAFRLGVSLGLIEELARDQVNELFILTQPGHLQKLTGRELSPAERDVKRAEFLRERLAQSS